MENNNQKTVPKGLPAAIVVLAVFAILLCSVFAGFLIIRGNNPAANSGPVYDSSQINMSGQSLAQGAVPEIYSSNVKQVEINGVGTKSSVIERLRGNTDSNLQSFKQSTANNAVYYGIGDDIVRIDIPAGINGFNYNRSYYFNNGILYFTLIYRNGSQSAAYYFDNVMYRYTDESGTDVYNAFNNPLYMAVYRLTFNEAYSFYNDKTGK